MNEYLIMIDQIHLEEQINGLLNGRTVLTEGVNIKERLKKIIDGLIKWVREQFKIIVSKFRGLIRATNNSEHQSSKSTNREEHNNKSEVGYNYYLPKNGISYLDNIYSKIASIGELLTDISAISNKKLQATLKKSDILASAFGGKYKGVDGDYSNFTKWMDHVNNLPGGWCPTDRLTQEIQDNIDKFNKLIEEDDGVIDKDYFNKDFDKLLNGLDLPRIKEDMEKNTILGSRDDMIEYINTTTKLYALIGSAIDDTRSKLNSQLSSHIKEFEKCDKAIQSYLTRAKTQLNDREMDDLGADIYGLYAKLFSLFSDYYKKAFESYKNFHYFYNKIGQIIDTIDSINEYILKYKIEKE